MWIGFGIYLLIGAGLAILIDRAQMKRPVPYEDAPAMIPLEWVRIAIYGMTPLLWPVVLWGAVRAVAANVRSALDELNEGRRR